MSINEEKLATCKITSNASCTTNASSPVIAILDEAIGMGMKHFHFSVMVVKVIV